MDKMNKTTTLLNEWRNFLSEAPATNIQDFAALVISEQKGHVRVILYNLAEIIENYKQDGGPGSAIKGFAQFGSSDFAGPDTPCYSPKKPANAWEMKLIAAREKTGPMLYDICLSIAKLQGAVGVMPDRSALSPKAEAIWVQYFERGQGATGIKVKKALLDAEPPENRTDTTDDDCEVWENRHEAVNYIYSVVRAAPYIVDLQLNHRRAIREILKISNQTQQEIEELIAEEGHVLFRIEYY